MPKRANIIGPPDSATSIRLSIAACHSGVFQHYRWIAAQPFDSLTAERIKEFIRELERRKEAMH